MLDASLREELHQQLLAERQSLHEEIEAISISSETFHDDEMDSGVDQHPADQGSELFEREKNLTVQGTLQASLREVNEALRKFDAGTYGTCGTCGQPIAEKRLRAFPAATHCITCQANLERMAHQASGRA